MTIVTILGEKEEPAKKIIEFVEALDSSATLNKATIEPREFEYIELISQRYGNGFDIMFAHDGDRDDGIIYLGHFNDGVVE